MKPLPYSVKNSISIPQNLIIPKTDHRVTFFVKPGIPLSIFPGLVRQCMLTAIQFDDELSLEAHKIDDILSNRVLTSKLHAFTPACAQAAP